MYSNKWFGDFSWCTWDLLSHVKWAPWHLKPPACWLYKSLVKPAASQENIKTHYHSLFVRVIIHSWLVCIPITNYTPYLALTGELWGVFCEHKGLVMRKAFRCHNVIMFCPHLGKLLGEVHTKWPQSLTFVFYSSICDSLWFPFLNDWL